MTVYRLAVIKLFIAAVIWGLSFTMVRWGLESFTTTQLLFWRFAFAFVIGEFFFIIFNRTDFKKSNSDMKLARNSGCFLGITILFQIHGLNFTTATNSAFVTSTYVVMIPFVAYFLFKQKVKRHDILIALLALVGMILLLNIIQKSGFSVSHFNYGDALTLVCAVTAAVQIALISVYARKCVSTFRFNNYQTLWALIVCLPFVIYESLTKHIGLWPQHVSPQALWGVSLLVFTVSILAFFLQVSAQKNLSTATASMLCLLEAPFSFLFATLLLRESISFLQAIGAFIIIFSAFASIYFEQKFPLPNRA